MLMAQKADWLAALQKALHAIHFYGGASVGMRTMLDAFSPAVMNFQQGIHWALLVLV
jgi:predicted component of type VI protein secretion system